MLFNFEIVKNKKYQTSFSFFLNYLKIDEIIVDVKWAYVFIAQKN